MGEGSGYKLGDNNGSNKEETSKFGLKYLEFEISAVRHNDALLNTYFVTFASIETYYRPGIRYISQAENTFIHTVASE